MAPLDGSLLDHGLRWHDPSGRSTTVSQEFQTSAQAGSASRTQPQSWLASRFLDRSWSFEKRERRDSNPRPPVTGRYGLNRHSRLRPGITRWSRHFVQSRTGCDRLRPVTTR